MTDFISSLRDTQIYLKLSRIQSLSDIDVILLHACDEVMLRSIIDAGHHLNLFNLHSIESWVLLPATLTTTASSDRSSENININDQRKEDIHLHHKKIEVNLSNETLLLLPPGILSLVQQQLPLLESPAIHTAIIDLIASAANTSLSQFLTERRSQEIYDERRTIWNEQQYKSVLNVSCFPSQSSPLSATEEYRELSTLLFK